MPQEGNPRRAGCVIFDLRSALQSEYVVGRKLQCRAERFQGILFSAQSRIGSPLHRPQPGISGRLLKCGTEKFEGFLKLLVLKCRGDWRELITRALCECTS